MTSTVSLSQPGRGQLPGWIGLALTVAVLTVVASSTRAVAQDAATDEPAAEATSEAPSR